MAPPKPKKDLSFNEDMFTSSDNRSMRRGRRRAPRTEVCRPCLIWVEGAEQNRFQGVMLDLNPHGMKIRMLQLVEMGALVVVQMMRDEQFEIPLSQPIRAEVVRAQVGADGFVDVGVRVRLMPIKRAEETRPTRIERPRVTRRLNSRMHTVDYTIGDRGTGRTGRGRG